MTARIAAGYIADDARTVTEQKAALEALNAITKEMPGGEAEAEYTASSGSITPAVATFKVRGQGGADDDLDTIVQTNLPAGSLVFLRAGNPGAEDITVRHNQGGSGKILLGDAANFLLDHADKRLVLQRVGTDWLEVARFYGGQKAALRAFIGVAIGIDVQAFDANTAKLNVGGSYTRHQGFPEVALTSGATVNWDMAQGQSVRLLLNLASQQLANPTNQIAGFEYSLRVTADGVGGRALTFGTAYDWGSSGVPDFTTLSANKVALCNFYVAGASGANSILASARLGFG